MTLGASARSSSPSPPTLPQVPTLATPRCYTPSTPRRLFFILGLFPFSPPDNPPGSVHHLRLHLKVDGRLAHPKSQSGLDFGPFFFPLLGATTTATSQILGSLFTRSLLTLFNALIASSSRLLHSVIILLNPCMCVLCVSALCVCVLLLAAYC
ncbi:uncharacterized protein BCR38DRAFT_430523 [Pseudomassariella vexata]|uniref:Uncharacterized protein n=1 Tax=Pseudomassariella vexata TaxID=1141098 RepID=A0A1Y2E4N1_9PEZI|nr:uncharacterized protein BCR38DRAFT_430523 [Pseudomassariella vexata]ORY66511.1 hypothetical protein BCR38DRAFT_430523 [Pseudomassariella vexata]